MIIFLVDRKIFLVDKKNYHSKQSHFLTETVCKVCGPSARASRAARAFQAQRAHIGAACLRSTSCNVRNAFCEEKSVETRKCFIYANELVVFNHLRMLRRLQSLQNKIGDLILATWNFGTWNNLATVQTGPEHN